MCDELTELDNKKFEQQGGAINRREFGKLTAIASLLALAPITANAMDITENDVTIQTPDGDAEAYFVHPTKGKHAGVLMWTDIKGLRNAFRTMAARLAQSGYAVLVPNPFYRSVKVPAVPEDASFSDPDTRKLLFSYARELTQEAAFSDAKAFIGFLDQQKSVDTSKKIGTNGYCMGGALVMRTAAAVPDRVGAGATFHAGRMVTDKEDSPHLLIPQTPAQMLHAVAENDDQKSPDTKTILAKAYRQAGIPAEIEVYEGTLHGWCSLDSSVYNEAQAEKAWSRMLNLFGKTLV
ncbi:MAG: dienelactone hydrolase family protein [Gammaproteobacteria bacterium]|nr:dienelactone hydrolase family protein [Gammaproteobacteria bacterium]